MGDIDPLEVTAFYDPASDGSAAEGVLVPTAEKAPARPPERIGRYRIERVLGKGGFGLVYLAHDEQLNRPVAVKVPHAKLVSKPEDAEVYLAEARTVANLDHPSIVPVHDVDSTAEFPCYVVSKYIPGTDLATKLKQLRPPYRDAAELVATVADALHYAHKQGLVHRDVKPGNILIGNDGKPYVVDFGLALREENFGKGPKYAGTPAYMSPEQARGEGHRVDGRSDIFSLGVVFYELLAGRKPFRGDTQAELMEQVTGYEPRPLLQYDEKLPKELQRICFKALSKRASERYSSAHEMAEDLRHFLHEQTVIQSGTPHGGNAPVASETKVSPATSTSAGSTTGSSASMGLGTSDNQPIKIVPKGLRSFDAHDADFFLELLPGPRDREGLPDSLRFWKTRIEETDPVNTFAVGLIYGPSGCGKSSLVKAGLLPRLSENVIPVYVEATAQETQTRLLHGLRKRCPALEDNLSLKDTLAALRRGQGIPVGKKVLIILDQFEQWLHAKKEEENSDLVQALRQCNGERVQCLVMVRDDFWMAATRFMRELEVRLLERENSAAVDLFPIRHAEKVLAALGRAYAVLPDNSSDISKDQKQFLEQAVIGLAQEGKVISVRLALFAEMMKGKVWTPATLKDVGGTEGVGVAFLEETFSTAGAPPEHRLHQKAARAVLKALLPESGTDIKGHMRSYAELLEASGYASRPKDFDDLIRILDREVRLITPIDPEGAGEDSSSKPVAGQKFYQLTHDYLVHSLRDWLTRKQKETRRGRAELRLVERAALWQAKPENRHLPSWWEYLSAVWLVPAKNRRVPQQKMLRQAGRVHAFRWGAGMAILLLIGFAIWNVVATERQRSRANQQASLHQQVVTAVDAMQNATGPIVTYGLRDLQKLPHDMVLDVLQSRYEDPEVHRKLGLAYALAEYGQIDAQFLGSQIAHSVPEEVDNFVSAFRQVSDDSLNTVHEFANDTESKRDWRLKARLAIVALHLEDDRIAADMCRIEGRPDPVQRTIFIDELPVWHGDVTKLAANCRNLSDPALRSAMCLAIGGIRSERFGVAETDAWKPLFADWYDTAPDNATHSAAGWALRQSQAELPVESAPSEPSENHERFVNSLGMTMLKVQPGQFVRLDEEFRNLRPQNVTLTQEFFVGDREVSVDQFQKFMDDPDCAKEDKPADWHQGNLAAGPAGDHPRDMVSWYDAVLFCNWLSRKEGLAPCYERTGKKEKLQNNVEYDAWRLAPAGTGYRLPTEAEWEYACRAGTTTDFSCGTDADLLRKYAVYATGTIQGADGCGSRLPNGWGLFDMHGNVWEYCHDWFGAFGNGDAADPVGPSEGSIGAFSHVVRGGSWRFVATFYRSGNRGVIQPDNRYDDRGFRVAHNPVRPVK